MKYYIITIPILVGGLGTPSIMDGKQLEDWKGIIPLELLELEQLKYGFLKSRYRIIR